MRYQLSKESAKYFLGRIQKSFKTEKPPQQLILDFIEGQNFTSLPQPYHVARLMRDAGVWAHLMHAEPATPANERDEYF
jgi:hypothetical protein